METFSAWTLQNAKNLATSAPIAQLGKGALSIDVHLTQHSLWLVKHWAKGKKTAFRAVFSEGSNLSVTSLTQSDEQLKLELVGVSGSYETVIALIDEERNLWKYTSSFTPKVDVLFAYQPKDTLNLSKQFKVLKRGIVHTHQVGNRSGIIYFSLPKTGSVFYFQDLTALNLYFEHTKTTGGELVGGQWPEIGFAPPVSPDLPLQAGQTYVLTSAYVVLDEALPQKNTEVCISYLQHLASIYTKLPKPNTQSHDWLTIAENGFNDMSVHPGCWTYQGGHQYLTAYLSDYKTPPEIMVQLAVLLPVVEYLDWKGKKTHNIIKRLKDGLQAFYKPELGTIVRWLPKMESNLDYSEEQKKPNVMDAWYLHHPLMNLARLATKGDKDAEKLLMDSVGYATKVAKTFNYQWPVFYEMETLKIIKAETAEGEGGEKDVPGTYADLMLKVWEITGNKQFLAEAKRSVKSLEELQFDIFYQANNTAFSAVALLKLYRLSGQKKYLELSYVCLASIFNNVQLWNCRYGFGKNFPSFFAIYPLKDAPYTAAYEEQEVFAALHSFYEEAKGVEILPAVRLLIAEFLKYTISRVPYYFAPMLPEDMLADTAKTGEIDQATWIAVEDLRDGWEQAGQVGQEVYGAGVAFGIVPRHYYKIPRASFMLFVDYPLESFNVRKNQVFFTIGGEAPGTCQMQIVEPAGYQFNLSVKSGKTVTSIDPSDTNKSSLTFHLKAKQALVLTWKEKK